MIHVNILFTKLTEHFTQPVWNSCLNTANWPSKKEFCFFEMAGSALYLLVQLLLNEGLRIYGYKNLLTELKFGHPYLKSH